MKAGFTLVEILVTISIIGLLSATIYFNVDDSRSAAADAERQANLKKVQAALELYKRDNGRYPSGCNGADNWSGQNDAATNACADGNNDYIEGLAPAYLPSLPVEEKLNGDDSGYAYVTNADGTVYKFMARSTVENETVNNRHEFSHCFMGAVTLENGTTRQLCGQVIDSGNSTPSWCGNGSALMQRSYGVWGGFAEPIGTASNASNNSPLDKTQEVACKQ